ncbi:MAG: hypothetical protein M1835_000665 [Candelina submexicana]|nr:MAG: hypothetical protein M1835_000665 [Candelina submexicana]
MSLLPSLDFGRLDTGVDVAGLVLVEVAEDLTTGVDVFGSDCLVEDERVVFLDEDEVEWKGDEDLIVLVQDSGVVEGLGSMLWLEVVDLSVDFVSVDDDLIVALVEYFTVDD